MHRRWMIGIAGLFVAISACSPKAKDTSATDSTDSKPAEIPAEKPVAPDSAQIDTSATDSTDSKPIEIPAEKPVAPDSAQPDSDYILADVPSAPLDKKTVLRLGHKINDTRKSQQIPLLFAGIVKGNAIVSEISAGIKSMPQEHEITKETLFNVQPEAAWKPKTTADDSDRWCVTADGLKKAGVRVIEVLPKGDYIQPYGYMANDEITAIDTKYVETQEALWTNINSMMRFLAKTQTLENLQPNLLFRDKFYEDISPGDKLSCNYHSENGYTITICEYAEKQLRFLLLANASQVDVEYYIAAMLTTLTGSEYNGLAEKVQAYDELMHSGSMRENAEIMEASPKYDYLLGNYHNDRFGDLQITKDNHTIIANTDRWRSRLGFLSSYDNSMTQEVDIKEAAEVKKTNPEYILAEFDSGALVNETIHRGMILFDPPVVDADTKEEGSKAKAIVVDGIRFDRIEK